MKLFFFSIAWLLIAFKHTQAQNQELSGCYRAFAAKQQYYEYYSYIHTESSIATARMSCKPQNSSIGLRYECQGNATASGLMPTNQYCTAVWNDSEEEQTKYECWDFAAGTDFGPFATRFF